MSSGGHLPPDRRITPLMQAAQSESVDPRSKLKTISGLIQSLSYRDMQEFAKRLDPEADPGSQTELIEMILKGTENILAGA